LLLPDASTATAPATSTVTLPASPASGVTASWYTLALTCVNRPLVPLPTVTSSAVNPLTASLKVNV